MLLGQPAEARAARGGSDVFWIDARAVHDRRQPSSVGSGATARATALLDEAARQRPEDTLLQRIWLPHARANIELGQGRPERALEHVRDFGPYEPGICFWVRSLRG